VTRAARALLRPAARSFSSQAEFRRALLGELRRDDPLLAIGARRLRRLLLDAHAVRLEVSYTERADRRPLASCPVCGEPVRPIRNRTLLGDSVTLGYRCPRCSYWTHLKRRVPTRYFVARATVRRSG
jgi:DNA-directed RNA polymerase subunit RPC12/RpoP